MTPLPRDDPSDRRPTGPAPDPITAGSLIVAGLLTGAGAGLGLGALLGLAVPLALAGGFLGTVGGIALVIVRFRNL